MKLGLFSHGRSSGWRQLIGLDELLLIVALLLIGAGMWQVWKPGALLAPGAVLLWLTLPTRAGFFRRSTHTPPSPERRKPWAS